VISYETLEPVVVFTFTVPYITFIKFSFSIFSPQENLNIIEEAAIFEVCSKTFIASTTGYRNETIFVSYQRQFIKEIKSVAL